MTRSLGPQWRTAVAAGLIALGIPVAAVAQVPLTEGPGLYEDGFNTPPPDHFARGLEAAALVRPLDPGGLPAGDGRIALVSIGMSNTTQEFCAQNNPAPCESWSFVGQALADPAVDRRHLVLVNGARGGQSAAEWDSPADPNYDRVRDVNLAPLGLTESQVQIAWVKVANPGPTVPLPSQNADAYRLVAQMGNIVRSLETRYRNLRIVYLSSRIYAGYATTTLNPEPYAFESGLAVKMLIQAQIDQMRTGVADPRAGDLSGAWIAWGPYLWANGTTPRSDGLIWTRQDFQSDGTHPSASGERKVGELLLAHFKTDPTARPWFLAEPPRRRRAVRSF